MELKDCDTCHLKSASLSLYENVAGVILNLCKNCLERRNITRYRPAFVAERLKAREVQNV